MKKIIFALLITLPILVYAQNPVTWNYTAKKIADKTYELHISARIQGSWHLYSQNQPAEAIAIPTAVKFNAHPLVKIIGKTQEIGNLEKHREPSLRIEAWQYSEKVEFVQTISLKANVKTNISGNIEYQACTNEKCLPPRKVQFSIKLE